MKQTDFKSDRNAVIGASIFVSAVISVAIVGWLMANVSGFCFFLLPVLVGVFTFLYQNIGYFVEEALRELRAQVYKDELKPWTMQERLTAITAWPLALFLFIVYWGKGSFNPIWEDLVKEEVSAKDRQATGQKRPAS